MPDAIIANRYKLAEEFSRDSLSILHKAYDSAEGKQVFIRILSEKARRCPLEAFLRYKRIQEQLSKLDHSNLLKVYSQGESDGYEYIVSEFVDYSFLSQILAQPQLNNQPLAIDIAVEIILQSSSVLDFCHCNNILHQSIQPQSILVSQDFKITKFTNFGFNLLIDLARITEPAEIISVFGYLSPEASGILKKPIDVRSDIYSLGILFYQLLTGQLPYQAKDISTLIYQHIATQPKPPSELNSQILAVIENMVLRLIAKDPSDRYQSLTGLITDLKQYQEQRAQGKECQQINFEIARSDKLRQLTFSTRLIGRGKELNQLKDLLNQTKQGKGVLCFIFGEPGIGKSRLIDELRGYIHTQHGIFIGGKCYQYEFKIPYKVFSEAIDAYIDKIKRLSKEEQDTHIKRIKDSLGELGAEVVKISPSITDLIGTPAKLVELEPAKEKIRFLITITNFIISLSSSESPLLLFLDDLQWVDEGSLEILERAADKLNNNTILLVVSYRDTDVDSTHHLTILINKLKQQQIMLSEIPIRAFSLPEATQMIGQILMEKEEKIVGLSEHLNQKAKGNPFFTLELLRILVEEQSIYLKDNHYIYDPEKLNKAVLPDNIVDVVLKRIEGLPEEILNILSYASVMGRQVEFSLLAQLTHKPFDDLLISIEAGIKSQLLYRDITGQENIFFMHDRIREVFYKKVPQEERIPLHKLIAYAIEEQNKENTDSVIYELAHHFTQAGLDDKALQYCVPAAQKARKSYANSLAIDLYLTSKEILEKQNKTTTPQYIEVLESLGETYRLAGKFEESLDTLKTCQRLIPEQDKLHKAGVFSKMGDTLVDKGILKDSAKVVEEALRILKVNIPANRIGIILGILNGFILQMLHTCFPKVFVNEKFRASSKGLTVRLLDRLAYYYYFVDMNKAFYLLLKGFNLAETLGPCPELVNAYKLMGPAWITFPWISRTFRDMEKGLRMAEDLGDKVREGSVHAYLSYCSYLANRPGQGLEYAAKGINILKGLGEYWDLGVAYAFRSYSSWISGRLKENVQENEDFITVMKEANAKQNLGWALYTRGKTLSLIGIDIDEALIKDIEESRKLMEEARDKPNVIYSLSILSFVYLRRREYVDAVKVIEEVKKLFPTHHNRAPWLYDLFPIGAQIYLDAIINIQNLSNEDRKEYLRLARWFCRKARLWSFLYNYIRGWTYQVQGTYLWLSGKKKQAVKTWDKGLHWLRTNKNNPGGDKYRIAYLLLEEAKFLLQDNPVKTGSELFFKKAYTYLLEAKELFEAMGCKLDLETTNKLLSSFTGEAEAVESRQALTQKRHLDSLLSVSKAIGSIFVLEELLDKIMEYALKVTGAERSFLFLFEEATSQLSLRLFQGLEKELSGLSFSYENYKLSLELINEVIKTKQALIVEPKDKDKEETLNKITQELSLYSVRQAIAIPLIAKEKLLGLIYLDNRLAGGMFGQEELELMKSFAVQASISIENAFLVKEIVEKERLAEELRLGRDIQLSLLPKELPQIPTLTVDGLMLPAKEIGGDYYDFIEISPPSNSVTKGESPAETVPYGLLAIVIGDVSGKGVAAGLLMAMAKTAIHTLSQENTSPKEVLLRTNSILYSHIGGQKFMTMLYFKYNPASRTLTYSSAGHEHILIYRNNPASSIQHPESGSVEAIISGGFMLGMLQDIEAYLEEHSIALEPKDKVLLYTDGVTDAENTQGERFGLDRLKDSFKANSSKPPFELIQAIKAEVYTFIGTQPQYDDITLVGMEAK